MKNLIVLAIVSLGLAAGFVSSANAAMTDKQRDEIFQPKGE